MTQVDTAKPKIGASIVIYRPDFISFKQLLDALVPQVDAIVLINNSAEVADELMQVISKCCANIKTEVITPEKNLGVSAHNLGLAWIQRQGLEYVLFFDQDSRPDPQMVAFLLQTDLQLRREGRCVAAVGPRSVDVRSAESGGFLRFEGYFKKRCLCHKGVEYCATDSLMLSGMLVKMDVFASVGLLDESLFMDNVDTEWGLRAKSKGFHSFGSCKAVLHHRVGDQVVAFLGRLYYIHHPNRQYYIYRNRVILYQRPYIALAWKINDFLHVCFKLMFHAVAVKPRRKYLASMMSGLRDGLLKSK